MEFKISKYNNLIVVYEDSKVELLNLEEKDPTYIKYLEFLKNDGTVEQSEFFSEEEEVKVEKDNQIKELKEMIINLNKKIEQINL